MAITSITVNNTNAMADESACDKLENDLVAIKSTGFTKAMAQESICALCQAGGTNNAAGTLSITINDGTSNIKITLKEIKELCRNLKPHSITLRQYARTRSQECHDVGALYNIPGDLAKKISHVVGTISKEDSFWFSSFQMDSPYCPQSIKNALVDHYTHLFGKK